MEHNIPKNKINYFKKKLLSWYVEGKRDFPWRQDNRSCYEIAIAEILLQRTRAETVNKVYEKFLLHYKSWEDINNSSLEELGQLLQPLGLWRQRAERLKALSSKMCESNGKLPTNEKRLSDLPLMGQYITNALLTQCYNKRKPFLDASMARVLERFFGPRKLADIRYDPYLQKLAHKVINKKNIEEVKKMNWAILDFAATICTKKPHCKKCNLSKKCSYYLEITNQTNN